MYFFKNLYTGPSIRDPEEVKSPQYPGRVPTSLRFSTASICSSRITRNILPTSSALPQDVRRRWNLYRDLCRKLMITQGAVM